MSSSVETGYCVRAQSADSETSNDDHSKPHHRARARQGGRRPLFRRHFRSDFNEKQSGHFAPVRVNETLTLLFDEDTWFDSHHYAFHVSEDEFDAIFERIKKAGLSYGSAPWSLDDGKLNDWNGGRGVYFKDPNGHVLELMTMPQ